MMSEKRFEDDGVEVERFMLVFGDDGTRVVDNQTGKELYAIDVVDLLNDQQYTIDKLEQRDYYNQSERYKILCRAIELTANYIDNSDEEHYDFCALVTEFEKELLDDE